MSNVVPNCPDCKDSKVVIKILYGKPTQKAIDEAEKGLIKLGGCCPKPEKWLCQRCQKRFK